ncbi:MAG: OprO/OprP family phosphate-selective porin, partial [Chitinispirillaceae bacterium]|nr:OprO/OprP family phosphate-selective porin [Chitinispirillaceae bacterium]
MKFITKIIVLFGLFVLIVNASETTEGEKVETDKEKIVELEGKLKGMEESFLETKSTVDKLNKLKISGYIQAQFQFADTEGVVTSMAGRRFDKGTRSTFYVRRGRIKFDYKDELSRYVFQFDGSSSGFEIKDAYVEYTEPFLKYFTGTIGIFDRPFGYEISYSSGMRESPERSRIYQTLFPKEREIGAKISFAAESGPLSYFNFKGGVFNGVTPLQLENNFYKDFIGRIGFELPLKQIDMAIDGGFSFYYGKIENTDTTAGSKSISKIDSSWTVKTTVNDTGGITFKASRKYDTTYTYSDRGITYEMDGNKFKKIIGCNGKVYDRTYLG